MMKLFDPALVERIGMWLNEYLYYFYYAEQAVEAISARREDPRRGDRRAERQAARSAARDRCHARPGRRPARLLHLPEPPPRHLHALRPARWPEHGRGRPARRTRCISSDGEGYAGVALGIIEALETGEPLYTALNVPNAGAIDGMRADDVVEVSCVIDRDGVRPLPIGAIPEPQEQLMRQVKLYERLTVEAIAKRSRATAVAALMAHPLVLSYSRAKPLVDEYLAAHAAYVGEWE